MWTLLPERGEGSGLRVECQRFDDVLESAHPPDVVKIDVEGGEVDVLSGGMELFRTRRPAVIVEILDETKLEQSRSLLLNYHFEYLGQNHWLLT